MGSRKIGVMGMRVETFFSFPKFLQQIETQPHQAWATLENTSWSFSLDFQGKTHIGPFIFWVSGKKNISARLWLKCF